MAIKFKIISVDSNNHSVVVRYFSDAISEDELASEFDVDGNIVRDETGSPSRCRTDYNIEIREFPSPSESKLKEILSKYAPSEFFNILEKVKDPSVDTSMSSAMLMKNVVYETIPANNNVMTDDKINELINSIVNSPSSNT